MTLILANQTGGGAGGSSTFTGLTDSPSSYSGETLKGVRVNAGETGLEFFTLPAGSTDELVSIDSGATPGYIGAAAGDGILRTDAPLTYTDGGDFVTLGLNASLDDLSDVTISGIADKQILRYDSVSGDFFNEYDDYEVRRIKAATGVTISKGEAVYISGAHNANVAEVGLAKADSASTMPAIGIAAEDLNPGEEGVAVSFGRASGVAANYTAGDTLYVSAATAGAVTNVSPTGASLIQNVGVLFSAHATNASVAVTGVGRVNAVPNITSANFWVGNASGVATPVALSGDATMDNAGVLSLAADSVGDNQIDYTAVTLADFTNDAGFITALSTDTLTNKSGSNSQWTNDEGYITATLTQEQVEDFVGGMVTGNTETLITVTYEDGDGTLDFVVENDLSLYDNATSGFITGNETITLSGDVTGSGTTAITTTIAAGAVDIAMLSATGTADATTYLRGDNTWATVSGSGDPDQNLWETVAGDTGSTAADITTDTLTIAGGTGITTAVSGDILTITASADGAVGYLLDTGDIGTGVYDFGGADSFEIPNSATPTVNADGEIALDTTVTSFSHGVLKYYGGEEMAAIAVPVAELTTPANYDVISYNSTADEFQMGTLTLPNNDDPTLSNIGEIYLKKQWTGSVAFPKIVVDLGGVYEDAVISIPKADMNALGVTEDGYVLAYDGTAGVFEMVAPGGGGDPDQNIWSIFTGDSGSTTANTTADTLTIAGGTDIATAIVGDTLTINYTGSAGGDPDQNLWETVAGDTGSTAANITTDTLTIAGGTNATTAMSGDTLTVNVDDAFLLNTGDVGTGAYDFGGATTFEIPNSIAPTLNTVGQIAVDTTVADFSHDILKYYGGEELGVVSMPIAQFTTPSDGYVVAYNATNDEFELVAVATGGDPDQNIFESIAADVGAVSVADTITDTLTLAGGTGITTTSTPASDTITFDIDDDYLLNTGDVGTGAYDFGGATTFEIPNTSAPTLNAQGQIAIDTNVNEFSAGVLKYWSGEEMAVVSMPVAQLVGPGHQYVVTYDATADEFILAAAAGNIVEDTTPQLGGDLDANGFDIQFNDATGIRDDSDNEQLIFQKTATAVNYFEITNAATGNAPSFTANGSDTNIDLEIDSKGTGIVNIKSEVKVDLSLTFASETDNGNSSTADTIDWGAGNKQKSTLTGNCTYTFTAPDGVGNFLFKVIQDATGSRTVTWPASVKWPGGTAPTLSTAANSVDIITFYYDGTSYYGVASLLFS